MKRWLALLSSLGQAVVELVAAEVEALSAELRGNAKRLLRRLLLLLVAVELAVVGLALLLLGLVRYLDLFLPAWLAALLPGAAVVLLAAVLGLWAVRQLSSMEGPGTTVRRRWGEQEDWWRQHVMLDFPDAEEAGEDDTD